ncbi:glucodextranase DOMON-like domain-containing protein [Alloscardovia theropitheci]|nr:glucodextranase DOMON-like domain-containing protein [Alloscardovia theropitheci]
MNKRMGRAASTTMSSNNFEEEILSSKNVVDTTRKLDSVSDRMQEIASDYGILSKHGCLKRTAVATFVAAAVALATLAGAGVWAVKPAYGEENKPAIDQITSLPKESEPVTWDYGSQATKNDVSEIADDQVRESPHYSVQVRNTDSFWWHNSFTYLSIPRNGKEKPLYNNSAKCQSEERELPRCFYKDGAEFAYENGFNMSWSSFVYSHDVWVKVSLDTGEKISSANDVTIRPKSLNFEKKYVNEHTIAVKVPYSAAGYRFSVDFEPEQTPVFMATNGTDPISWKSTRPDVRYRIETNKWYVETEPRHSMMIFAQPEVRNTNGEEENIPRGDSPNMKKLEAGEFPKDIPDDVEIIYLKSGVHWMGAHRHAEFKDNMGKNVRWIYFEPGAFLKGGLFFNNGQRNYKVTGYGVLSGEQYVYEASTKNNFDRRDEDKEPDGCHGTCVKALRFTSTNEQQKLILQGVTLKEPAYHSFVVYGNEDSFEAKIRNYQQVGAWYWQSDGVELYKKFDMQHVFFHANDDVIKIYHPDAVVKDAVIWKNENGPVVQWGWTGRDISNVTVEDINVIHSRMDMGWASNTCVLNSAGDLYPGDTSSPSPRFLVENITFKNFHIEGALNCAMRIDNQRSMKNVKIDGFYVEAFNHQYKDDHSRSKLRVSSDVNGIRGYLGDPGQRNGLIIHDFYVGNKAVTSKGENDIRSLGRVDIDSSFENGWSIDHSSDDANANPEISLYNYQDGSVVTSRLLPVKGKARHASSVSVYVNGIQRDPILYNGEYWLKPGAYLNKTNNNIRVVARGYAGQTVSKIYTITVLDEKIGYMADALYDDNGPGSYTYPKLSEMFAPGNFDMTHFDVYEDSRDYHFATTLRTQIVNPWLGVGISAQQLHIYLRDKAMSDKEETPLRAGTQTYAKGKWNYAIVVDGRQGAGVYLPNGEKVGDVRISADGVTILASVSKGVFGFMNIREAKYQVSMYSSGESSEGVGNIRPVYSTDCLNYKASSGEDWLGKYRFGGGKGDYMSHTPFTTDTSGSNALDIFIGYEKDGTQSQFLSLNKSRAVVPYVGLAR